jgi:hypothetical protein
MAKVRIVLAVGCLLAVAMALMSRVLGPDVATRAEQARPLRDFLELAYFATNSLLPVIALLALIFAWQQVKVGQANNRLAAAAAMAEADAARSQAYMAFFRTERPKIEEAIELFSQLEQDHRALPETEFRATTLGGFVHQRMRVWERSKDTEERKRHNEVIGVLITLENLALLVRRDYLALDDIYFFLEGPIDRLSDVLLEHVRARKARSPDKRECEHTEWLFLAIARHVPSAPLR